MPIVNKAFSLNYSDETIVVLVVNAFRRSSQSGRQEVLEAREISIVLASRCIVKIDEIDLEQYLELKALLIQEAIAQANQAETPEQLYESILALYEFDEYQKIALLFNEIEQADFQQHRLIRKMVVLSTVWMKRSNYSLFWGFCLKMCKKASRIIIVI